MWNGNWGTQESFEREYNKLVGKRASFKAFLLGKGPSLNGLDVDRDRSPMRDVEL